MLIWPPTAGLSRRWSAQLGQKCNACMINLRWMSRSSSACFLTSKSKAEVWSLQSCRPRCFVLLQDALPVLIDLQLRAIKQSPQAVGKVCRKERQSDAADAHFSREYMAVMVGEVQQVLRKADMDVAAQQAQALMHGSACLALTGSDAAASRPAQAKTDCLLRCA